MYETGHKMSHSHRCGSNLHTVMSKYRYVLMSALYVTRGDLQTQIDKSTILGGVRKSKLDRMINRVLFVMK